MAWNKKIGILGGMGPKASAHFYERLIEICNKEMKIVQDSDFPHIILYNVPLHDWNETGITSAKPVKRQLIKAVKVLEQSGCDFIVMACNTAHLFHKELQESVKIPILNLIKEVSVEVAKSHIKVAGILSSRTTNEKAIYETPLLKLGMRVIKPNETDQNTIDDSILSVMSGTNGVHDAHNLYMIARKLALQGAEAIVLGCTEIPVAIKPHELSSLNMPIISSTEVGVRATLQFANG